jgi:plastocyanin
MDRRTALRLGSTALLGTLAGCGDVSDADSTSSATLTPADVPDPDVTVEVGPDGDAVFAPGTAAPVGVPPDASVQFVWRSDGHNVVVANRPAAADWRGTAGSPETLYDTGHVHTHTFETPGIYRYYCHDHRGLGMEGTLLVGLDPEAWTPSPTPLPEELRQPDADADADAVVVVGPGGRLVFDPAAFVVDRGALVAFVWAAANHSVVVDSRPAGATWTGSEGPPDETYDRGHVHEHTFETLGTYEYHCEPHEAAGMTGRIVVE